MMDSLKMPTQQTVIAQDTENSFVFGTKANEMPPDWQMVRLGDWLEEEVLTIKNGFPQGSHNEEGQGVPHLRPFNVTNNGSIDLSQIKSVAPPAEESPYWVHRGDVVFNNTNSEELVGKTAYFPFEGKFVLSNHMTLVRVLDPSIVDAYWLAKKLHYLYEQGVFKALCRRHVNQASVSLERFKSISFPCPPISAQRAISKVLQTVQEAIQTRRDELELERERKAALMEYLFTHGTRREPLKLTEIGEMPESWEVMKLRELCTKITDGTHFTPTYVNDGVPFLRVVDIQGGQIDWKNVKRIPKKEHDELIKRCKPEKGDVLLSKNGTIGRTKVIDWDAEFSIFVSLCLLKPKRNLLNNIYLAHFLESNGLPQILKRGKRMTVTNLHLVEINELLIPLPSLSEQAEIVEILEACNSKIATLEEEISLLEEFFRALLEELMTGRLLTTPLIEAEQAS